MKTVPAIKFICKDFNIIAKNMKDYKEYKKIYKTKIVEEVLILYNAATTLEEIKYEHPIEEFR